MKKPSKTPPTTPKAPKRGLTKVDSPTPAHALAHETAPLPVWRGAFFLVLAETGNATLAARAARISRARAYAVRAENPDFAQEWTEALAVAVDLLEDEARKLATGHYVSYKFRKNGSPYRYPEGHERAGEAYAERVVHPGLLQFLLKAHRPEVYGDKLKLETNRPAPAYDLTQLSPEELAQLEVLTKKATPPALPQ